MNQFVDGLKDNNAKRRSTPNQSGISHASVSPTAISATTTVVQAKLEMTEPGDQYEREADSMADIVMAKSFSAGSSKPVTSGPSSKTVSRLPSSHSSVSVSPSLESAIASSRGTGSSMPFSLRSKMESGFNADFSSVRFHTDSNAAEMSSSINAKAFTSGRDVYFAAGQYNPNSQSGQHLIAHELAHTMQQSGKVAREGGDDYDGPYITENKFGHNRIDLRYTDTGVKAASPKNYSIKNAIYLDKRIPLFQRLLEAVNKFDDSSPEGVVSGLASVIADLKYNISDRMEALADISQRFIGVEDDALNMMFHLTFGRSYNPSAINQAALAACQYANARAIALFCKPIISRTNYERSPRKSIKYLKGVVSEAVQSMMHVTESDIVKYLGRNYSYDQINNLYLAICRVVNQYDKIDDGVAKEYAIEAYGSTYGPLSFEIDSYLTMRSHLQNGLNLGIALAFGLQIGAPLAAGSNVTLPMVGQILAGNMPNMIFGEKDDNMSEEEYMMGSFKQSTLGVMAGAAYETVGFGSITQSAVGAGASTPISFYRKGHPFEKADLSTVVDLSIELTEKSNNPAEQLKNRLLMYGMRGPVVKYSESMLKYYQHTDSWMPWSTNGLVTLFEKDEIPILQSGKGDKDEDYSFEEFTLAPEEKEIIIKEIEEVLDL